MLIGPRAGHGECSTARLGPRMDERVFTPVPLHTAWQGPSHRGGALQQGVRGWAYTALRCEHAGQERPPGAVAGDSLPYRFAHGLLCAQLCRLVQHPPVHALVLRVVPKELDDRAKEGHVPCVQDPDQVRAAAWATEPVTHGRVEKEGDWLVSSLPHKLRRALRQCQ